LTRRANLDDLVTGAEIGRRLGITRARVSQLAGEDGFPEPLGRVGNSVVWRWRDVERWAKRNDRPIVVVSV
jgi:predicted DNA-binding transcriptional regulator AlpA